MTASQKENDDKNPDSLIVLDELISKYYKKLLSQLDKDNSYKLGDLLKMIELRKKLVPDDLSQKQFWKMLETIRKENLTGNNGSNEKRTVKAKKKAAQI